MNSKIVLIIGCFVLFTILSDNTTTADKNIPKLYEEIGCNEVNEASSAGNPTRWATFHFIELDPVILNSDVSIVIVDNNVNSNNLISINRFECPDVAAYAIDKCYLKGKTFNVGDDVTGDIVPSCRAACKCLKPGNESASIICANIECPEHFGSRDWSCVSQYDDLKQCCRIGEICGKIIFWFICL